MTRSNTLNTHRPRGIPAHSTSPDQRNSEPRRRVEVHRQGIKQKHKHSNTEQAALDAAMRFLGWLESPCASGNAAFGRLSFLGLSGEADLTPTLNETLPRSNPRRQAEGGVGPFHWSAVRAILGDECLKSNRSRHARHPSIWGMRAPGYTGDSTECFFFPRSSICRRNGELCELGSKSIPGLGRCEDRPDGGSPPVRSLMTVLSALPIHRRGTWVSWCRRHPPTPPPRAALRLPLG